MDINQYKQIQGRRFEGEAIQAHKRQKQSYKFFRQFVTPDMSVLDIGTRDGWMTEYLQNKGHKQVLGIELVDAAVKHARERGRNVISGDAHDLSSLKVGQFDAVLMIHSFEHCHNPTKVVEEVRRVMCPNGLFYIEVPVEAEANRDMAHFCCFTTIEDVTKLVGSRFEFIKSTTMRWDKDTLFIGGMYRRKE